MLRAYSNFTPSPKPILCHKKVGFFKMKERLCSTGYICVYVTPQSGLS